MKWQHISNKFSMVSVGFQTPKSGVWWTCWLKEWNRHNLGICEDWQLCWQVEDEGGAKSTFKSKVRTGIKGSHAFLLIFPPLKCPPLLLSPPRHRCSALTQPTVSSIKSPYRPRFSPYGRQCSLRLFGKGMWIGYFWARLHWWYRFRTQH